MKDIKRLLREKDQTLALDLVACSNLFGFLPAAIKTLESNHLTLAEQLSVLDSVKSKLAENQGRRAEAVYIKFENVFAKNLGK